MKADGTLTLVRSHRDLESMFSWLGERRPWLAIDIETTGLNVGRDKVRLFQIGDARCAYALDWGEWKGACLEAVASYSQPIVLQNALFDLKFLKRDGMTIPQHLVHDTMIMAHLADPVRTTALKPTARRLLGPEWGAGEDVLKSAMSAAGWDWATVPTDFPAYWQYACLDTVLTATLAEKLWPSAQRYREAYEVEMAFIHVLRDAEIAGVAIDPDYCRSALGQLQLKMATLLPQIHAAAGREVNPLSDIQVIALLQEQGATLTKRTERGQLSTDKHVLLALRDEFPVAGLIAEYKETSFLVTSHFSKMLELAAPDGTGHLAVHPSTRPVGARTGRTSVTDPPLQTIPRGRVVRDGDIAREGHRLVLVDYDGMEMRFMAGDAPCPAMLEAYGRGEDVHKWVASEVFGVPQDAVDREMRGLAKNAGFAKIYGAGVETFADTAGVPPARAQAFLDRYDELFPEVVQWQQRLMNTAMQGRVGREWPYVETILGRKLPVEPDKLYKVTNFRDQGSCAEIAKMAANRLANAGLGDYFRVFVHDELMLEVPEEDADDILHDASELMKDDNVFADLTFTASGEHVQRWGDKYSDEVNPLRRVAT